MKRSQFPVTTEFEYMLPWYFVKASGITMISSRAPLA